ncbi:hypothetical protein JVU11DRAFT_9217 [Chiua virens]|nr:hypothetical protein JVU11DRAFT_9217 [Chiua virens]
MEIESDLIHGLGTFLWNHYRTAVDAVRTLSAELDVLMSELNLSDDNFQEFHEQERRYLNEQKLLSSQDQAQILFVCALDDLAEKKCVQQNVDELKRNLCVGTSGHELVK